MRFGLVALMAMAGTAGYAQDTRVVAEPKIPVSCVTLPAALHSVGGTLAEADEQKLDTARIQAALDTCKPGQAVELKAAQKNDAFLTAPLELRTGVTLLLDKGVTLFGSRDPKVYEMRLPDAKPGSKADDAILCGTSRPRPGQFGSEATIAASAPFRRGGCRPLIAATNVTNAAVMGDGTIDGRGYAQLLGKDYSWWQMARRAEPKDDIYYSTKLITASHADGFVLYRITLHNSPNYHVTVGQTDGFTAWGVHLLTPVDKAQFSGKQEPRNTDGIDPGNSTNITIAHSWIDNGDDNIAIKANVQHISVLDNHFYSGHGMSIGSEANGDAFVLVDGLTEENTTSGIRIKSNVTRGGPDHDLTYRNICMRGVRNPIAISPYYTNQTTEGFVDPGYKGTRIPDYKKVVLQNIYSENAGDVLIAGINDEHRTEITLDGVHIEGLQPSQLHLAYDDIHIPACPANHNAPMTNLPLDHLPPTVKLIPGSEAGCGVYATNPPDPCTGKFLPMR
jgi:polygalacturonase